MRIIALEYYHEFDEYYSSTKDFLSDIMLDCIPNPRLSIPRQKQIGYVSGFPTFHGGVTVTDVNFSPYKFLDETGRF